MPALAVMLVLMMAGLRQPNPGAQAELRAILGQILDVAIHLAFKLDVQLGIAMMSAAVETRETCQAKTQESSEGSGEAAADAAHGADDAEPCSGVAAVADPAIADSVDGYPGVAGSTPPDMSRWRGVVWAARHRGKAGADPPDGPAANSGRGPQRLGMPNPFRDRNVWRK
jgi:hypothetical protein